MNIHPLFVHFPIALLSIYSVLEILRFRFFRNSLSYFHVRATFVILGSFFGLITLQTGDMAKHVYHGPIPRHIIEIHSNIAGLTVAFFCVIAFFYVIGWIRRSKPTWKIWSFLVYIETLITERWLGIVFGIIGLCLISTVGALGGLIAYGPNNDAISAFLYSILK